MTKSKTSASQADESSNIGPFSILNISSEIDDIKDLFECVILALGNPSVERYISNATQTVMLVAQGRLENVAQIIENELDRKSGRAPRHLKEAA